MKTYKKSKNVVYQDGYDHYDRHRNIQVMFLINEAEKAALDDMTAALGVTNLSEFIRGRLFSAYSWMTDEQKKKMKEVAEWRATEDKQQPINN